MRSSLLVVLLSTPLAAQENEPECGDVPLGKWVERLKSPDFNDRVQSVKAVEKIGPRAKGAVPAVLAAFTARLTNG